MGERYLREESQGYCSFEDQPEVLENILQKYHNLEENVDEFLFEFVRPYIEQKLTPLYQEFIESEEFREMKKELRAGEMFEWVLSARTHWHNWDILLNCLNEYQFCDSESE